MSRSIIGTQCAGFTITDAQFVGATRGYAVGVKETEYVTWGFVQKSEMMEADFYHGHYFRIDADAPRKSRAKAYADYHQRLADAYEQIAEYGD